MDSETSEGVDQPGAAHLRAVRKPQLAQQPLPVRCPTFQWESRQAKPLELKRQDQPSNTMRVAPKLQPHQLLEGLEPQDQLLNALELLP